MQKKYFKDKRIFITGINGFIGSHLAKKLETLGARIYGISRSISRDNILKADILDFDKVNRYIRKLNIKICIHLAGESFVESGQKDPYLTFKVNIEGALNILEIGRINKLEKIIIASTSHVYGDNKLPYLEKYIPTLSRPYETSKTCIDMIAQSYADNFKLPVLIPRFVNIYGPGDLHFNRLIPKTMKAVILNKSPEMWGGTAVRDYLYIDDAVSAYLHLLSTDLDKIGYKRIFNFGGGNIISVKDLIQKIIGLSGKKLKIKKILSGRKMEIKSQYVSWQRAIRLLNWRPRTKLNDGLKKSMKWYQQYLEVRRH